MQSRRFQFVVAVLTLSILAEMTIEPLASAAEANAGDQSVINQQHREHNAKRRAKRSAQKQERLLVNHRTALPGQAETPRTLVPESTSAAGVLRGNENNTSKDFAFGGPYIGLKYKGNE